MNPDEALDNLGARWSPDFDDFASGRIDASQVTCLMCGHRPCLGRVNDGGRGCPEFGSAEYMARLNEIHGRTD